MCLKECVNFSLDSFTQRRKHSQLCFIQKTFGSKHAKISDIKKYDFFCLKKLQIRKIRMKNGTNRN